MEHPDVKDLSRRFVELALEAQRLRESNKELLEACKEAYRLYCIKGLDPTVRRAMQRYAINLMREAIAHAQEQKL